MEWPEKGGMVNFNVWISEDDNSAKCEVKRTVKKKVYFQLNTAAFSNNFGEEQCW